MTPRSMGNSYEEYPPPRSGATTSLWHGGRRCSLAGLTKSWQQGGWSVCLLACQRVSGGVEDGDRLVAQQRVGGGVDNGATVSLVVPCILVRRRDCGGADGGARSLAQH
jgi:hypothetical protein